MIDARIIIFILFSLEDRETRYSITDRKALAIIRYLTEVRWLINGGVFPIHLYTNHSALIYILGNSTAAITLRI